MAKCFYSREFSFTYIIVGIKVKRTLVSYKTYVCLYVVTYCIYTRIYTSVITILRIGFWNSIHLTHIAIVILTLFLESSSASQFKIFHTFVLRLSSPFLRYFLFAYASMVPFIIQLSYTRTKYTSYTRVFSTRQHSKYIRELQNKRNFHILN